MTTLFAAPCIACHAPVTVVRRRAASWCSAHHRVELGRPVVPAIVDADGSTHICKETRK